jgi:hypothetical protein
MKFKYFGDSYDIVKKSLIAWLSEFGPWVTHPMFTEEFKSEDAAAFSRLLVTPLLSNDVLTPQTDRTKYFASCLTPKNLFLDPDAGVSVRRFGGARSTQFVFGEELVKWSVDRPKALTLIFDQSYSRGSKDGIQAKLAYFADKKIHGFAYNSHTTFLLLGADPALVKRARGKLLKVSGLPAHRLVSRDLKEGMKTT